MRVLVTALLAVALVSCSDDPSASRPTPAGTTAATSTSSPGLVVALGRGSEGVDLYRVGTDRKATLLSTIRPPAPPTGASFRLSASRRIVLSGGPTPVTCVLWERVDTDGVGDNRVRCYAFGDAQGFAVDDGRGVVTDLALSADGTRLAWVSQLDEMGSEDDLVVGELEVDTVRERRRLPTSRQSGDIPTAGCPMFGPISLAWVDGDRLLLGCNEGDDFNGALVLQSLSRGGPGAEVRVDQPPYNEMLGVVSAGPAGGLGVQGQWCEMVEGVVCPDDPERAVRFDVVTGKVLEVIATADKGRGVQSVSGGDHGVVYVTTNGSDGRVYLRLPGEKHGVRVTGIVGSEVVAQP